MDGLDVKWRLPHTVSYTLLRVVSGLILLQAGGMKILGWLGGMPDGRTLAVGSQTWIGGWLELIGGALLMVGLFTRWTAFVMSGMMAVAYFQFHQPNGTWPAQNGGVAAVMVCFACLVIWAFGAGPWSVDSRFSKRGEL
jgi:putative oxidoreductase